MPPPLPYTSTCIYSIVSLSTTFTLPKSRKGSCRWERSTYSHTTLLRVTLLHKLTVHTKCILVNIIFKMQLIQLVLAFVLLLSIASGILTSPNLSSLLISPPRLLSFCSSLLCSEFHSILFIHIFCSSFYIFFANLCCR